MLKRVTRDFAAKSPEFRCYAVGGALVLLSSLAGALLPGMQTSVSVGWLLAATALAAGFLFSALPRLRSAWDTSYGKATVAALNLAVLVVATALSRSLVASALGLPPQDFDLTVSALTLVMYLPVWSLLTAAVATALGACFLVTGFICDFFPARFRLPVGLVDRGFGAIAFGGVVLVALAFAGASASQMSPLIRWAAYFLDFHPVHAYPGIPPGAHVRLHENGIISIATRTDGRVDIVVRKLE